VKEQAAEFCRLARCHVVYDGIDPAAFLSQPVENPAALRTRYGIGESARVVASVGGIQRRKGQLDLIEAAPPLVREFPDLVFVLAGEAGDADYLAAVDARIAELGLEPHFRLIGFEPHIRNLFSLAEALVHPSHSEGFSLAILEAMVSGLPVVATRCGGPEEIVEENISGLLVPVQSPDELARALRRLLADPEAARTMGEAAAARARAFSLDATAREVEEVYRQALASVGNEEILALRALLADLVAYEVLILARRAARHAAAAGPPAGKPTAPRNPPGGN
jgi:glycosyltransferase involved in cell wall biosynthesis